MNSYDSIVPSTEAMQFEEMEWEIISVFLGIYLGCMALALVQYVLSSLSLYTIADKRKISSPILAWFPFGFQWILGSLADFFDAKKGMKATWAKTLLLLTVIPIAGFFVFYAILIVCFVFLGILSSTGVMDGFAGELLIPILIILLIYLVLVAILVVSIAGSTLQFLCLFKIYEAMVPEKRINYLLISLLVPLGQAICLFRLRNGTAGMEEAPPTPPAPPVSPTSQENAPKDEIHPHAF